MTDPYSGGSFSDPQSENIQKQLRAKKFASTDSRSDIAQNYIDSQNAAQEREQGMANWTVQNLLRKGADFRLLANDPSRNPEVWYFDPGIHSQIWRRFPDQRSAQNAIYERLLTSLESQNEGRVAAAIESKIRQHAETTPHIRLFNEPRNAVFFANGVFDWGEGGFRGSYRKEDWRNRRGSIDFDPKATADNCSETLRLVHLMAGGDPDKERLIHAVNVLNIVGVHTLGSAFKSGLFVWTCPNGYSGRSTLLSVVQKASGGGLIGLNSLEDLEDRNYLAELEGSTGVFVDERQEMASAKSKWVSTVKSMVGGTITTKIHRKYEAPRDVQGHWVVNQSLNSLDFLYGADRPLQERVVALKTVSIPKAEQQAFNTDIQRIQRIQSVSEASSYLVWLRSQFGSLVEVAEEVDRLKGKYLDDIQAVASSVAPENEFFDLYLDTETATGDDALVLSDLLTRYNQWLGRNYPRHKKISAKQLSNRLKSDSRFGESIEKIRTGVHRGKVVLVACKFNSSRFNNDLPLGL